MVRIIGVAFAVGIILSFAGGMLSLFNGSVGPGIAFLVLAYVLLKIGGKLGNSLA